MSSYVRRRSDRCQWFSESAPSSQQEPRVEPIGDIVAAYRPPVAPPSHITYKNVFIHHEPTRRLLSATSGLMWLTAQFGLIHGHPALTLLFWVCAIASWRRTADYAWTSYMQLIGASFNALVMVTNGGFMPVVGSCHVTLWGFWRPATQADVLLSLADHCSYTGFSIGDCLIISFGLLRWVTRKATS